MRALIMALALACASLSAAPPASAQTAAEQAQLRAMEGWLAELAVWSQGYQGLQQNQYDLMTTVVAGLEEASAHAETGNRSAGRAWASQWRTGREAEIAALEARMNRLAPEPPALPALDPEIAGPLSRQRSIMAGLPAAHRAMNTAFIGDLRGIIAIVVGVAEGDPAQLAAAPAVFLTRSISMSRSSITLQELALAMQPYETHPQASVLRAGIAAEHALIAFFELMKVEVQGGASDRVASAGEIRRRAQEVAREADAMQAQAQIALRTTLGSLPEGSLRDRMRQAVGTYDDSARLDRRLARALTAVADLVQRGEPFDAPALDTELAVIEQVSVQRVEVDNLRRAHLAG